MRTLLVLGAVAVPLSAQASWNVEGVRYGQNGVKMQGVKMQGVKMQGVKMQGVSLLGASSAGATLDGTNFVGSLLDAQPSTCSHSQQGPGAPLPASCNKCAEIVGKYDSYCSNVYWDSICVAEAKDWCAFESADLVGAEFIANLDNNTTVPVRLDRVAVVPDPTPTWVQQWTGSTWTWVNTSVNENADVLAYEFSVNLPAERECGNVTECEDPYGCWTYYTCWESQAAESFPLCNSSDDDGLYNQAIPVAGKWNDCVGPGCGGKTPGTESTNFSLACRDDGALAKCTERFGYKPWEDPFDPVAAPLHESCVRMVRADDCGDGQAHTYTGTWIDAYDQAGVQQSTTSWGNEGVWNPDGAFCVINGRYEMEEPETSYATLGDYIENECPGKFFPAGGQYADRWRCGVDLTTEFPGTPVVDANADACSTPTPGWTLYEGNWCAGVAANPAGARNWVEKYFNGYIGNKSRSLPWPGQ